MWEFHGRTRYSTTQLVRRLCYEIPASMKTRYSCNDLLFWRYKTVYFLYFLVGVDEAGNKADISNIVAVLIRYIPLVYKFSLIANFSSVFFMITVTQFSLTGCSASLSLHGESKTLHKLLFLRNCTN